MSLPLHLKCAFEGEIHLIPAPSSHNELVAALAKKFTKPLSAAALTDMTYRDQDGDEVTLNGEDDYAVLRQAAHKGVVRIKIGCHVKPIGAQKTVNVRVQEQRRQLPEVKKADENSQAGSLANEIKDEQVVDVPVKSERRGSMPAAEPSMCIIVPNTVESAPKGDLTEATITSEQPTLSTEVQPVGDISFAESVPAVPSEAAPSVQPSEADVEEAVSRKIDELLPNFVRRVRTQVMKELAPQPQTASLPVGPAVHNHVICDGCGVSPIEGARFKCAVCADYDLCAACEAKDVHVEHAMLKIRRPQHALKAFFAVVNEESQPGPNLTELNGVPVDWQQAKRAVKQLFGGFGRGGWCHGRRNEGQSEEWHNKRRAECPYLRKQCQESAPTTVPTQAAPQPEAPKTVEQPIVVPVAPVTPVVPVLPTAPKAPAVQTTPQPPRKTSSATDEVKLLQERAKNLSDLFGKSVERCFRFICQKTSLTDAQLIQMVCDNPSVLE